jgi:copper chaperone NosL
MNQIVPSFIIPLFMVLFSMTGTALGGQPDIDEYRDCAFCGMDRKAYGFSRMLIRYEDGAVVGTCSLHCAVVELDASPKRTVQSLLVADRESRTLLEAEKAIWVAGGKKRGVMTEQPTWAFQTKEGAEAFIKVNGGRITNWNEVLAAAREETVRKAR